MLCKSPYEVHAGQYVSCGQCLFCRINRARIWQSRILLEEMCWENSIFATLTLDEIHVPSCGSVNPRALQLFMKRLRKRIEPFRIRFYGVGEYGEKSGRPHYHVALFGVAWESRYCEHRKKVCLFSKDNVVEDSWPCGDTHIGLIEKNSARYITQYVTKFMNFSRSKKLGGRHPEFARMSNRPGIGAPAVRQIALKLLDTGMSPERVVGQLNYGSGTLPLGRYLEGKLHDLRGGDCFAKDREIQRYLSDVGLKYCDQRGMWSVSKYKSYKDDGLEHGGSVGSQRMSVRSFHLGESKAKRFTIEANRRQFSRKGEL